jgi:hypothetical protein
MWEAQESNGKVEFSRLGINIPKKIVVEVLNSDEVKDGVDVNNDILMVYNKNSFKKNFQFDYDDYLKYMMQLYA